MRLAPLILAAIAPLLADCGDSGSCPLPSHPFSVEQALLESSVDAIVADSANAITRAEITCEMACEHAFRNTSEGNLVEMVVVDTCVHMIGAEATDPDAVVGNVMCAGEYRNYCPGGRRPLGHVELGPTGRSLADYLAACAHMEAASIVAFAELSARLVAWGAPQELADRCRVAADEETRHAALLGALAVRAGAVVPRPVQRPGDTSRLSVALHNAVEGCVVEAWAAVQAAWFSRQADDPALRAAYASIARDEAEHAQLAWDLHTWLMSQLPEDERAQVQEAQRAALAELPDLAAEQATFTPPVLRLPSDARLRDMAGRFAAGLAA